MVVGKQMVCHPTVRQVLFVEKPSAIAFNEITDNPLNFIFHQGLLTYMQIGLPMTPLSHEATLTPDFSVDYLVYPLFSLCTNNAAGLGTIVASKATTFKLGVAALRL